MRTRPILVFIIILMLAVLALGQDQKGAWKEYVYENDGFAITLPLPPYPPHADPALPDMTVYTVALSSGRLSLRVSHRNRGCSTILTQLKDGALAGKSGINPSSVKEVSINGNPGLEYEYKLNPDQFSSDRYYCVDEMFYAFSSSWPSNSPRPAAVTRILNSFRLLKSAPTQTGPASR
jgi:hypothetical protein